ncbi:MAG: ASPIC/UnbV domain-containing protein [Planctomycetota bacterium]
MQLYRNSSAGSNADHNFLTLELEGDPTLPGLMRSTRDAIGSRAYVTADFDGDGQVEADETRIEEVLSGHSNSATTSSLALEFGIGMAERADVRIVWGSGRTTTLHGVAANQFVAITEQATALDVLIGDYNGDRHVDAADYAAYRDMAGTNVTPFSGADGNGDGRVDAADAAAWRNNYGLTAPTVVPVAAVETSIGPIEESTPEDARSVALATITPSTAEAKVRARFTPTPRYAAANAEAVALLLVDDGVTPKRDDIEGEERAATDLNEEGREQSDEASDVNLGVF